MRQRKQVLVYSMGRDGSGAVEASLSLCRELRVRRVHTLDRGKVAGVMLRGDDSIPGHIRASETILRDELPGRTPFYFVTLAHDPVARHLRHGFHQLQARVDAGSLGHALANADAMRAHWRSVPSAHTTGWFESEYRPATGIDVYKDRFDHAAGCREYRLGLHRLLVLSAHLPAARQTDILADFLDEDIAPVLPETSPLQGLQDFYAMQALSDDGDAVIGSLLETDYARHFFTAEERAQFRRDIAARIARTKSAHETIEHIKTANARDTLLEAALSPLMQASHLTASIGILAQQRGLPAALGVAEAVLKQLDRARNNALVSAMRAAMPLDADAGAALGERWIGRADDARGVKALAACMQRASAIARPLALLESLPDTDAQAQRTIAGLAAQARLLRAPFPFTAQGRPCSYVPVARTVLYNAHQSLPFHTSGYATRTHGVAAALRGRGWDVRVEARAGYPVDTGAVPGDVVDRVIDGVPYAFDARAGCGQRDMPMDAYLSAAAARLVERAQHFRPSVIHTASNYMCGIAGIEAARRLGLPGIYEMRGLWHVTQWSKDPAYAHTDKFALAQKMELKAAKAADHVLAITGALKEWLVEHGVDADRISIAPNAVNLSQFPVRAPDAAFADSVGCAGKIVIGYIGSFVQYEGLDLLLDAVAMLPAAMRRRICLLWIGDGPVLPLLMQQAQALGIGECVISLGRRPFEEVPRAYSIVDIAAFPRKGQAVCEIVSPLKPFEAMAMCKGVIVSDVRPLKEIVAHGVTGLVHEKDNAQSLSATLAQFIDDDALRRRCGAQARAWIEETRQWDATAATIAGVYETLTGTA